jgi:rhodanese-related sulfurtransferase
MVPRRSNVLVALAALACALLATAARTQAPNIFHALLAEPEQRTAEVSTAELQENLAASSAIVLDARPHLEFAISHIPGALNVAAKPGVSSSMYVSDVAEVGRLVSGNRAAALVLYCNGPHCGKSKRLADELLAAGYTNVRRYQLGIPVWRALGGVTEIELDGLRHVLANDRTAVVIDTRDTTAYRTGTLPNARHVPRSGVLEGKDVGEVRRAKDDGRLPMNDHNTRIIVVGSNMADARHVAEALAREAFHNVAFYRGTVAEVLARGLRP